MARVDEDVLADRDTTMVFLACNLREAEQAEALLTRMDVDYCVWLEPFLRPSLFAALGVSTECVGLAFTVASDRASFSREVLRRHGLRTGIVEED
jgi:hypothetical protein